MPKGNPEKSSERIMFRPFASDMDIADAFHFPRGAVSNVLTEFFHEWIALISAHNPEAMRAIKELEDIQRGTDLGQIRSATNFLYKSSTNPNCSLSEITAFQDNQLSLLQHKITKYSDSENKTDKLIVVLAKEKQAEIRELCKPKIKFLNHVSNSLPLAKLAEELKKTKDKEDKKK
jgi:hypothetical protein